MFLKALGKRVIFDAHEDVSEQILSKEWIPRYFRRMMSGCFRFVEAIGAAIFDGVVTATPHIARRFPPHKTVAVQNFPVRGELCVQDRPYSERDFNAVFIGGMSRIRGCCELVDSFNLISNPKACLLLVGGFQPSSLEAELKQRSGWKRVRYLGWRSRGDVRGQLANSRVGSVTFKGVPNHMHAQPNKLFEYMAAGLPIVASNFPLWKQLIDDVGCGIVVDPEDPEDIAAAINWLLDHRQEAEEMGKRGQAAVEETFNWDSERQTLLTFYERLLHENPNNHRRAPAVRQSGDRESGVARAA